MTDLLIHPEINDVPRNAYVADRPIDFEAWVALSEKLDTELNKGVMVGRMAAQYPHEWLFLWLASILRSYTRKRGLGVVLGSRTAVKIDRHNGRLPDILFVRAEHSAIIHADAVYGTPDVVIEIVSPSDRSSDLISLESDYSSIGVPEIVFIDPQKKNVRVVRRMETGEYEESILPKGRLELHTAPGFWIEVEWIFAETQPDEIDVTLQLLRAAGTDV